MNINLTIFLLCDLSEGLQNNHVKSSSLHKHMLHAGNKIWVRVLFILVEDSLHSLLSCILQDLFSWQVSTKHGTWLPIAISLKLLQEAQIM